MGGQVNYPAQKRGVVDQNGMKKAQGPEGSLGWLGYCARWLPRMRVVSLFHFPDEQLNAYEQQSSHQTGPCHYLERKVKVPLGTLSFMVSNDACKGSDPFIPELTP